MHSRIFRISLAVMWLLFTSVIVPAHTRGYITWGKADQDKGYDSCCQSRVVSGEKKSSASQPTEGEKKRCAVCFTVALFDTPPAFVIWADYLSDALHIATMRPETPILPFVYTSYHSRAPPAFQA